MTKVVREVSPSVVNIEVMQEQRHPQTGQPRKARGGGSGFVITPDGFHITAKCRNYLAPLISGEAFPPFENGLPRYVRLKNVAVKKKTGTQFKL